MATGAARSRTENPGKCSPVAQASTLAELGMTEDDVMSLPTPEASYPNRPWHEDPEWVTEICESLQFSEVFSLGLPSKSPGISMSTKLGPIRAG